MTRVTEVLEHVWARVGVGAVGPGVLKASSELRSGRRRTRLGNLQVGRSVKGDAERKDRWRGRDRRATAPERFGQSVEPGCLAVVASGLSCRWGARVDEGRPGEGKVGLGRVSTGSGSGHVLR